MKSAKLIILIFLIMLLIISCTSKSLVDSKEDLGDIKVLKKYLPDEKATWIYKGTGVYHHEMTLEQIFKSDQSIYYKIKGEILSDSNSSNFDDYLTEIRYIISRKGWQQELSQKNLLDSKYKGMYILKFPIKVGTSWQEQVIDFNDNRKRITSTIESINTIEDEKIITVKYSENNSDYYEIRKIKEKKGVIAFEKNEKINDAYHQLKYALVDFYYDSATVNISIKKYLIAYNKAWQDYYNNETLEVMNYYDETSDFKNSILNFEKTEGTTIDFLDLTIHSIEINQNQYRISVEESFIIYKDNEEFIQNKERTYFLLKEEGQFKIIKIE